MAKNTPVARPKNAATGLGPMPQVPVPKGVKPNAASMHEPKTGLDYSNQQQVPGQE